MRITRIKINTTEKRHCVSSHCSDSSNRVF